MASYVTSVAATIDGPSTTSLTIPSVAVGSGQHVAVIVTWRENSSETVSAVTFNGSGTGWSAVNQFTSVGNMNGAIWWGTGFSGTQNIVVTMSSGANGIAATAFVVSNATTPTVFADEEGAGAASVSDSLTSGASDLICAAVHVRADVSADLAFTAPATQRTEVVIASNSNTHSGGTRAGSGGSTSITSTFTNGGFANSRIFVVNVPNAGASPATLSSATPSGTLGTSTTATLGATTDQASGTFYGVVDTAGNITGINATQVKAGQNNASSPAVASNSSAVGGVSPSTGVTGLTPNTAYSYAVVQNNVNGDSNVLTGTFTTAVAAANPGNRVYGPQAALKTLLTM